MTVADVTKGVKALDALDTIHTELHKAETELDPLALYLWLYRLQTWVDACMANVLPKANAHFKDTCMKEKVMVSWAPIDFARLTMSTPPITWTYPAELVVKEEALIAEKAAAQLQHTAKHHMGQPDPDKHPFFRIALTKV